MAFLPGLFGEDAPEVTDPREVIREEDLINRPIIDSPFGGRTISKDAEGRSIVSIQETPFQKAIREAQEGGLTRFFEEDPSAGRSRFEQALFDRSKALIDPERERQRKSLETSLSLKGLGIGSEAFRGQTEDLRRAQSEQLQQLSLASILGGGQEQRASRAARLGELTADVSGRGFLQGLANVQPINVGGIFGQADALRQQAAALDNERRQNRFDIISSSISEAFTPPTPKTGGTS
jgi:hypothetical protein